MLSHKLSGTKSPVSQSCAVAQSEKFWWATGHSSLADRMEDSSTGQGVQ